MTMNIQTIKPIREIFMYELEKNYDCECKVASLLPDIVNTVHSKELKRQLSDCLDGAGLSFGKLEILFHLINHRVQTTDNKVVIDMIEECRAVRVNLSARIYDITVLARLQQIFHSKVASYNTMAFCAVKLKNRAAYAILCEMLKHEIKTIKELDDTMAKLAKFDSEAPEIRRQK